MNANPVSKVLILDESHEHQLSLKNFCDQNGLVALKPRQGAVMNVLQSNIDLGAILLSEQYGASAEETARIASDIHRARPELPIIMRRQTTASLDDLSEPLRRAVCAAYVASDLAALREVVDERIFCLRYPNALLRGIMDIALSVLTGQFSGAQIQVDTPYIVHDRLVFGELFSLMQLESSWCRGYMMLQAEELPLLAVLGKTKEGNPPFRVVNDLLAELTNLIWGALKNRYLGDPGTSSGAKVPLVVNHKQKYISFGTENPQLCFRFTLTHPVSGVATTLYTRFVFNLNWSPDDFTEIPQQLAGLVESGELDLF
ncbi:MAG TPA: chemotaxis protein CheX [Steroidobacteraceae bacterium]